MNVSDRLTDVDLSSGVIDAISCTSSAVHKTG